MCTWNRFFYGRMCTWNRFFFAAWLVGMACEASGIDQWLMPFRTKRRLYSVMRLGHEALVRRWSSTRLSELLDILRYPSPELLDQLGVPA